MLLSRVASGRWSSSGGHNIFVVDARKAHTDLLNEIFSWHCASAGNMHKTEAKSPRHLSRTHEMGSLPRGILRCVVHGDGVVSVGVGSKLGVGPTVKRRESFFVKEISRLGLARTPSPVLVGWRGLSGGVTRRF